jgi:hypothetical protein
VTCRIDPKGSRMRRVRGEGERVVARSVRRSGGGGGSVV